MDVSLAKLGPEMESALLCEWLVADGAVVAQGEPVATVETDKVTTDLEAPAAGTISLLVEAGQEYPVGTRLAAIAGEQTGPSKPEARAALARRRRGGEPPATPVARRLAAALGVPLAEVGSAVGGRVIRKRDVEAAAESGRSAALAPMRRRIAERMHQSLRDTAQITDFREHDVSELVALRGELARWGDLLGFRASWTDLFVRATALALRAVPALNASLTADGRLVAHDEVNVGVAVALPDGIIVPVLRRADELTLGEIHARLEDLVSRAREGRLAVDEVSGGTFTLTNIGSYGSQAATPILVEGQLGIIATGAFVDRPVVRDAALAVGTVMTTSLTIDHRVIDGRTAGEFQSAWGRLITDPDRLR